MANQAGQALTAVGRPGEAVRQFQRALASRDAGTFPRVHALRLSNLAESQARTGDITAAIATWTQCLAWVSGVRSQRVRRAVLGIEGHLRTLNGRLSVDGRLLQQQVAAELRRMS